MALKAQHAFIAMAEPNEFCFAACLVLLGIVVGIQERCWLLQPFAIYDIKPKLDELTAEVRALKEAEQNGEIPDRVW